MTTTACDDQCVINTERHITMYSIEAILRRNVADLEIALRKQTERAEAAEAELEAIREDNHSMMLEIDGLRKELAAQQAATAPRAPTDEQIHAAYRNALGQSIRERDMPEIRKFAHALLQSANHSEQELLTSPKDSEV